MTNIHRVNVFLLLVICLPWIRVTGFGGIAAFQSLHGRIHVQNRQCRTTVLFNAAGDNDGLRKALENSWNTSMMGRVPIDPESAAKEAHSSILQAAGGMKSADGEVEETDDMAGIFFVDLLLPAYDIRQVVEGINLYDEVTAVEYCIALADCFKGKTEILVKEGKTVRAVTKVLKAREERERQEREAVSDADVVFGDGNFVDNQIEPAEEKTEEIDTDPEDDFRSKLMASWNNESDAPVEDGIDMTPTKKKEVIETPEDSSKSYRLASLFGDAKINQGADMASFVIQAVRENALARDEEDNIIILSAIGVDEMVAVRGLVAKYASEKKIILVNCQFNPVPRELMAADTVYSVLPLAGKKKTNDGVNLGEDDKPPPKIVVLRRYPKDWEVFVDVGIGYELAETVRVDSSNRRGLSMEYIARAVTRHLDYVARR